MLLRLSAVFAFWIAPRDRPTEQARIVALLMERVDIGIEGLDERLRRDGLAGLANEMTAFEVAA